MNQKPLVPEADLVPLFNKLQEVSQKILGAAHLGDLVQMGSLLKERADLLETLAPLNAEKLSPATRKSVTALFQEVQALEPEILQQLSQLKLGMEEQLHTIQEVRAALLPYKIELNESQSTRSTEA